ncbi:MAG TPA: RidA family protein [Terriglobales bacterium]|nr:RidA family protein [Terriglobales bacterium]
MRFVWLGLLMASVAAQAQIRAVAPSQLQAAHFSSAGVDAGDYVYVSAQSARRPDGSLPAAFAEQCRQSLENVRTVLQAAGLNLENVVYAQVYLEEVKNYDEMNRVFDEYFAKAPAARAVLGVAKLRDGAVQVNAVAVRNLADKRAIYLPYEKSTGTFAPGVLTHDRLFVSGTFGGDPKTMKIPQDPGAEVDFALDRMQEVLKAAGLELGHMVFVNPYLTTDIPHGVMNEHYARRFEFGNTPARATIEVTSLPGGAHIEYTGVAVRDLKQRQAVRPKNMPPSPTASPCVFAGDTLYCSAKDGFIPGPHGGIYARTTQHQLRQTMRNLLDNLEEAGMRLDQVVATNVYLDDWKDLSAFDAVYGQYFGPVLPARTTVQQIAPAVREPDQNDHFPGLEQVSLIAIRNVRTH